MEQLYRSSSFESMREADAWSEARAKGLLPPDAWTENVGGNGHYIAFYSRDAEAAAAINARIAARVHQVGEHEEVAAHTDPDTGEVTYRETGRMEPEFGGYPELRWTPMRATPFAGWEPLAAA